MNGRVPRASCFVPIMSVFRMNIHCPGADGEQSQSRRASKSGAARWDRDAISLIFMALSMWMLCHPFRGIVHDNRLYALLAFNDLDPATFARDVFLMHGSQDSFTLFSPLYAGAISLLGLDWSTKLLVVAGQALWLLGAFALARRIMAPPFCWLALLFLACYPPAYGGNSIFAIGEGFLSPRLYAEAFSLFAIAAFLGARYWLAALMIVLGGLLHPLMVAAPAGVILVLAMLRNRPWWMPALMITVGTLGVISAMAAIHLSGSSFLVRIDPEWMSIITHRTGQLLIANWTAGNWLMIACDAMLVGLACLSATPQLRQLLVTVLAMGLASVVTSFIAFDLLGDVITGKIQIWRALWLLHVMAPMSLALVIRDIGNRTGDDRRVLLLLAFSLPIVLWLCHDAHLPPYGIALLILLGTIYVRGTSGPVIRNRRDRRLILAGMFALVSIILARVVVASWTAPSVMQPTATDVFQSMLVCALLVAGGILALTARGRGRRLLAGVALLALVGGLLQWDMRMPWRRYMDSTPDIARQLPSPVAPGEIVYWPADVMTIWGALGNPSFFSEIQGAGAIFNRDTAFTFRRRLEQVSAFEPYAWWKDMLVERTPRAYLNNGYPKAGIEDLASLCKQEDHPDIVVLAQDIPGAKRDIWRARVPFSHTYAYPDQDNPNEAIVGRSIIDTFYFYRCTDMRQGALGKQSPERQNVAERGRSGLLPRARADVSEG